MSLSLLAHLYLFETEKYMTIRAEPGFVAGKKGVSTDGVVILNCLS